MLRLPVFMTAPAGAKIRVAGVADVALPAGTAVTAPRRKDFTLRHDRQIQLPQTSGGARRQHVPAVVSALVTIFAIGVEIGVVGVLASRLSVAVFALWYSHTAIRAITDSQASLLHQRRYRLVLHPLTSIPGMGPEAFTWRRTTTNGQG